MFPTFKPSPFRFAPINTSFEGDDLVIPPYTPRIRVRYIGTRRLIEDNGIDGKLYLRRISVPLAVATIFQKAVRQGRIHNCNPSPEMHQLSSVLNYLFWHPSGCSHEHDCCGCSSQNWYTVDTVPGKRREFIVTISVTYNV